jgi:hypothetical protein
MTQQSVRQSAGGPRWMPGGTAHERGDGNAGSGSGGCGADRLGERDGAVAMQEMTEDDGLSVRAAVEWCGSGDLTVREVTRLRQLAHYPPCGGGRQRATHRPARPFAQPLERPPAPVLVRIDA